MASGNFAVQFKAMLVIVCALGCNSEIYEQTAAPHNVSDTDDLVFNGDGLEKTDANRALKLVLWVTFAALGAILLLFFIPPVIFALYRSGKIPFFEPPLRASPDFMMMKGSCCVLAYLAIMSFSCYPASACKDGDCKNGGFCATLGSRSSCMCQEPYAASDCTSITDYCTRTDGAGAPVLSCQNGGTCTGKIMTPPYYSCSCVSGYTGPSCEFRAVSCSSKPCINGRCTDLMNNYSCSCYPGWEGRNCSVDTNYCVSSPCLKGGRCLDGNSTFACNCSATDYQGPTCRSRVDDCQPNPCLNGGVCADGVRSFKCTCLPGYSGSDCSVDFPDCSPSPCESDGVCFERSKAAHYNFSSMPSPFNGPFNASQAVGFMCLYPQPLATVATVAAVTAAVSIALSVSIFLIVLSQIGKGNLALGVFEKRPTPEQLKMREGNELPLSSVVIDSSAYIVCDRDINPEGNEKLYENSYNIDRQNDDFLQHQNQYETSTGATRAESLYANPDTMWNPDNTFSRPINIGLINSVQTSANAPGDKGNYVDDVYDEARQHEA